MSTNVQPFAATFLVPGKPPAGPQHMNNRILLVFLVILVAALVWRVIKRPPSLRAHLKAWADANNLTILTSQRRVILAGPFFFDRSGIVYRISALFGEGTTRTGWVKFGYNFSSIRPWSSKAFWDEPAPGFSKLPPVPPP